MCSTVGFKTRINCLVKPGIRSEPADQIQNMMWAPTWTVWWDLRAEEHVLRSFELPTPHRACTLGFCGPQSSTVPQFGTAGHFAYWGSDVSRFSTSAPEGSQAYRALQFRMRGTHRMRLCTRPRCTSPSCKAQLKPLQFCSLALLVSLQQLIS